MDELIQSRLLKWSGKKFLTWRLELRESASGRSTRMDTTPAVGDFPAELSALMPVIVEGGSP